MQLLTIERFSDLHSQQLVSDVWSVRMTGSLPHYRDHRLGYRSGYWGQLTLRYCGVGPGQHWGTLGTAATWMNDKPINLFLSYFIGPDSLVVRASASGAVGCGFPPRPRHTKGGKNGTGSSLADACNKRVVPGRYKKTGGYSLLVMSQ